MKYIGSKILESENLILRPTQEEDLKVIWEILCNVDVAKYYLVGKFNYDWDKEKKWQYKKLESAKNKDVFRWSIILKSQNICIGQISCQNSYDESGNVNIDSIRDVGWFLDSKFHSMGFGTEATKLMLDYMFNEVGIEKIEISVAIDNQASWKLMEKFGFHRTKKIKKVKYTILIEKVDCYCYEITRKEYLEKNKIQIIRINNNIKYLKEYVTICYLEWSNKEKTLEEYVTYKVNKILNSDNVISILGLTINEELIGFVSLLKSDGEERKDLTPWYATMYVKDEYRGLGYSKMLNKAILKEAKFFKYNKVYLKSNLINYYEKIGAKFIEKLKNGESLYYIDLN